MSISRVLVPFSAGVVVGVALHKYWPAIREATGPRLAASLHGGSELLERGRTAFWEKSERFADVIAEIREEEAAGVTAPPAARAVPAAPAPRADIPRPPSTSGTSTSGPADGGSGAT